MLENEFVVKEFEEAARVEGASADVDEVADVVSDVVSTAVCDW